MNLSTRRQAGQRSRGRGDSGAAVLEFALISVVLFTLIFGIISFGLLLSFKQDMTRAAAEGARAGAVAYPGATAAQPDAKAATDTAVKAFGGRFSADGCYGNTDGVVGTLGLQCLVPAIADCVGDTSHKCVTVALEYDYKNQPLYGIIPFVSAFMPEKIIATSVARING